MSNKSNQIDWDKLKQGLELAANLWVEQVNAAVERLCAALAPVIESANEEMKYAHLTDDELKELIVAQEKELAVLKKKLEVLEAKNRLKALRAGDVVYKDENGDWIPSHFRWADDESEVNP